ncbi:MAG TPA: carbohydrate ABC transporter permease [Candidatus Sumerlaeota bacterium]|nr:MAG: L-arabinose transport system permease protein AraQ [candidate division BRC1 bacterium ADurb.Bin183]HOE63467.1 carbohydrate ABC transporter permease [Candidatus Sumerlaeota bacterium]HRU54153.1 carbohydrate ABC transporter permease [Candidatus Sumerlaeia bacterium]HON50946.1 carbohydrate ABC transporter permease [Candidatus Sumerlaeota bacterium]HOR65640.1 carbohydrate ABC transporter permease [Candidatus Sumerlaeota bacterium]
MPLPASIKHEKNIVFVSNIAIFLILVFGFRFLGWKGILVYAGFLALLLFTIINVWQRPRNIKDTITYQALLIGGFFMVLPFYWMFITSFKSYKEALAFPPTWWPTEFHWKNWVEAWNAPKGNIYGDPPVPLTFTRYFYVSIMVGIVTTCGSFTVSALAAYAFARMQFWGRGLFFYIIIAMMMIPGQVLLIPNYLTLAKLRWLDHYQALIIPWLASVFSIFLLRQFFITIPEDLWDAAQIDGAGRFRFLWQIVIPLSKPVIITAGIFDFLGNWNSLFWPLIVTTRPEMRTLMVGLQAFNQDAGSDFHLLMAASTFAVLPIVIMFFFLQRFFIQGIARTGLK